MGQTDNSEYFYYSWDDIDYNEVIVKVEAYDQSGNMASDQSDNFSIIVNNNQQKNMDIGIQLFGIPVDPYNTNVNDNFDDDYNDLQIWEYSNGTYDVAEEIYPGQGYWIIIEDSVQLDIEGDILSDEFIIDLNEGWNIVSNQY